MLFLRLVLWNVVHEAGRFIDQDIHLFEKTMQLDYFGSLYVAKATIPAMIRRKKGHILFIASPLAAVGKLASISWEVLGEHQLFPYKAILNHEALLFQDAVETL